MKNLLSQLNLQLLGISPRTLQLASVVLALAFALFSQAPDQGPGGIR
jgi:hypothetical protein